MENIQRGIYKVQHFLAFRNTLAQHKVRLVSFHMEGKALTWFQELEELGQIGDWDALSTDLLASFGPSGYDDSVETLSRLRQYGIVGKYKDQFESLLGLFIRSDPNRELVFLPDLKPSNSEKLNFLFPPLPD